jgi:hypothetical protein
MINLKKSILAIALFYCSNFSALSISEEAHDNIEHIRRGQAIFKELEEEWTKSTHNTLHQAINLAQNQNFLNIYNFTLFCIGINAVENYLIHGNYSIFSNPIATISSDFFQYIGRTYQNKTQILRPILLDNGFNENTINSLYIPQIRTSLNHKLEEIFKNTKKGQGEMSSL